MLNCKNNEKVNYNYGLNNEIVIGNVSIFFYLDVFVKIMT